MDTMRNLEWATSTCTLSFNTFGRSMKCSLSSPVFNCTDWGCPPPVSAALLHMCIEEKTEKHRIHTDTGLQKCFAVRSLLTQLFAHLLWEMTRCKCKCKYLGKVRMFWWHFFNLLTVNMCLRVNRMTPSMASSNTQITQHVGLCQHAKVHLVL